MYIPSHHGEEGIDLEKGICYGKNIELLSYDFQGGYEFFVKKEKEVAEKENAKSGMWGSFGNSEHKEIDPISKDDYVSLVSKFLEPRWTTERVEDWKSRVYNDVKTPIFSFTNEEPSLDKEISIADKVTDAATVDNRTIEQNKPAQNEAYGIMSKMAMGAWSLIKNVAVKYKNALEDMKDGKNYYDNNKK